MHSRTIILAAFLVLLFSGCGSIYLPGGWDANLPQTTPLRMNEPREYAGAAVDVSSGYNIGESNVQGKAFYAIGTGGSWWRLSGSGFFYAGSYDVLHAVDSSLHGSQFYAGPGALADGNISLPMGDVSLGLGVFAGFIAEFGPYTGAWSDRVLMPLGGGYAFLSTRLANQDQIGLQAQFGLPGFFAANLQYDLGDFMLSAGTGITFSLERSTREAGRVTFGAAYRVR